MNIACLLLLNFNILASHPPSPKEIITSKKSDHETLTTISSLFFEPVTNDIPPKPNPFSIISIQEKKIDDFFGKNGLNVDTILLKHIKNFYFYLEYITKLEVAAKIAALMQQKHGTDPLEFLSKGDWKGFINKAIEEEKSWEKLLEAISTIETPAFNIIKGTISFNSWHDLLATDFWKKVTVTPKLMQQSFIWQKYIKYALAKLFEQTDSLLDSILQAERRLFIYIPHIEIAYYNEDFNHIRKSCEYFRLNLILFQAIQQRLLNQSLVWNTSDHVINWQSIYEKTQDFKQTPFYSLLAPLDQDPEELKQKLLKHEPVFENQLYIKEPLAQSELTLVAMILNLQARLAYLFDTQHLIKTCDVLKKNATQLSPSLITYKPEDQLYLSQMNAILDYFQSIIHLFDSSSQNSSSQVTVQGFMHFIHKVGKSFKSAGGTIAKSAKSFSKFVTKEIINPRGAALKKVKESIFQAGNELVDVGKDIAKTTEKLGKSAGDVFVSEGTAIYKDLIGTGALITGNVHYANQLFKESIKLQNKAVRKFEYATRQTADLLNEATELAKKTTYGAATLFASVTTLLTNDPTLGNAISRGLENIIGVPFTLIIGGTAIGINFIGFQAALAARLVVICEQGMVSAMQGNYNWNQYKDIIGDFIKSCADQVSFVGEVSMEYAKECVKTFAYTVSAITQGIVDEIVGVLEVAKISAMPFGSTAEIKKSIEEVKGHKRIISQLVSTALLVGATVVSGGTALPILAMALGPQVFFIGGGYQDDEAAQHKKAEQKEFLHKYEQFINNNKIVSAHTQKTFLHELKDKFNNQINNQERELGFYQNMLNNYIVFSAEQLASSLGNYLAPQLTVDAQTGLRYADVGAIYGIKTGNTNNTGILNLNPSQGFPLYSLARKMFSQEIAVYPAPSMQIENKEITSDVITKFWFNQRETYVSSMDIQEIEVRFQILYLLNTFHIGLYIGGNNINVEEIIKTKKASINTAHLAKMLVYRKENKEDAIELKLYEHEGKGWFNQKINGPELKLGTWYRIKTKLAYQILSIKVWQEGEPEPLAQTFHVEKTDQKTIGMISSGASIEYQFIKPSIAINSQEAMRKPIEWQNEKERALDIYTTIEQETKPVIGVYKLSAFDNNLIMQQKYIYTDNKDVFLLATYNQDAGTVKLENIGASPRFITNTHDTKYQLQNSPFAALISIFTGVIYSKEGSILGINNDILTIYQKETGKLSKNIVDHLDEKKKEYITSITGPFNFGSITIKAIDPILFGKGIFIYQATSPDPLLRDKQNPIKNDKKEPIYDYFMMINKKGQLGAAYSSDITSIESLVTGSVYDKTSIQPIQTGFITGAKALKTYIPYLKNIDKKIAEKINAAAQFYTKKTKQPLSEKKSQTINLATLSGIAQKQENLIEKKTAANIKVKPAQKSLEHRSQEAAAGQESWGA